MDGDLLIVGGDSMIGGVIRQAAYANGLKVISTTRREQGGNLHLDLAGDISSWDLPQVSSVIFCAAMARLQDCANHPELSRKVNVEGTSTLARRFAGAGVNVTLLSTNQVFSGETPRTPAETLHAPRTEYGRQKAEAERAFLSLGSCGRVLRLAKVFPHRAPLLLGWVEKFRQGQTVRAFTDMTLAPVMAQDVADVALAVASGKEGGIFQMSARDDVTYWEAARFLARQNGLEEKLVEQGKAAEVLTEPSPRFTSLDSSRTCQLCGWVAPSTLDVVLSAVC